jgi:hypothetical protein
MSIHLFLTAALADAYSVSSLIASSPRERGTFMQKFPGVPPYKSLDFLHIKESGLVMQKVAIQRYCAIPDSE